MKEKSEHLPVIIGISMLFVVFLVSGGLVFSFVQSDAVQQDSENSGDRSNFGNISQEKNQSKKSKKSKESEKNITVTPPPIENQRGGMTGIDTNSQTNIYTGSRYSTPSIVNSSQSISRSSSLSKGSYGMSNLGSSVERNRSIQENISNGSSNDSNFDSSIPDYSSPSASNNFNQTSNQSLIQPSNNNSLLNPADDGLENLDNPEETTTGITTIPSTTTTSPLDKLP